MENETVKEPKKAARKEMMLSAMQNRDAVRVYDTKQQVSKADMDYILETARLSPSSVGLEGWRFIVLNNEPVKQSIKAVSWGAQPQIDTANYLVLLVAARDARYDSPIMLESLKRRGFTDEAVLERIQNTYRSFQENDMALLTSQRALDDWTAKQTYIALANMMTAAALIGIDSCPIEGFNYQKVNTILHEAGIIDCTKEGIASMVSFGYRLKPRKRDKVRKPTKDVIFWIE